MEIQTFVFNPFYENTYVLWDQTGQCLIVDPGCYEKFEIEELTNFISLKSFTPKAIVNTHCHIDHVLGNYPLKKIYNCPLMIPTGEKEVYHSVSIYAPNWGINKYQPAEPDRFIDDGELLVFGETTLKVLTAPGHSPGHQLFYNEKAQILIGGDVLFRESIGRTDLPGGNHQQLLNNIRELVFALPEEVIVYPGHGPTTTIGFEKKNNPFVKA